MSQAGKQAIVLQHLLVVSSKGCGLRSILPRQAGRAMEEVVRMLLICV
jgi:hypothetical protein